MLMFIYMSMSFFFSVMFILGSHPMFLGLLLLTQVVLISFMLGGLMHMFLFSYVLFLVFVGGVLVLFMYVVSLAGNESFYFGKFNLLFCFLTIFLLFGCLYLLDYPFMVGEDLINYLDLGYCCLISIFKFYNYPGCYLTLFLGLYLLLALLVVVGMVDISEGPLRSGL
nr:NADH dehydrogenase subunit 6 [Diplatys flavicollis]